MKVKIFLSRLGQAVRRGASVAKLGPEFRWHAWTPSGGIFMIVGTGLDLARIDRIARVLARHPGRFERRVFTPREIADGRSSVRPEVRFAECFALKEAVFKALGTGWGRGGRFLDIETCPEVESEVPHGVGIDLSGRAAEVARERGVARCRAAVSRTSGYALALVVFEGLHA